jgi:hypothetical protein
LLPYHPSFIPDGNHSIVMAFSPYHPLPPSESFHAHDQPSSLS